MIVIGLTGSIGMGKSTLARQLGAMGVKVCNADDIVHRLLGVGGEAVAPIAHHFPSVIKATGAVDRKALGAIVFQDKAQLKLLESIMHPLVVASENNFVSQQTRMGAKMVVLDIPLLFETGAESRCDITLVATAPHFIQRQRVLKRSGMTEEKFASILRLQMPDREKRRLGDIIIHSSLGKAYSFRQLAFFIQSLQGKTHEA